MRSLHKKLTVSTQGSRESPEQARRLTAAGLDHPATARPGRGRTWTWLILAVYAQLWLARPLTGDLRRPWEKPAQAGRLTPARVRRGFATSARRPPVRPVHPKPSRPGPGRPREPRTRSQHGGMSRGKHQTRPPAPTAPEGWMTSSLPPRGGNGQAVLDAGFQPDGYAQAVTCPAHCETRCDQCDDRTYDDHGTLCSSD